MRWNDYPHSKRQQQPSTEDLAQLSGMGDLLGIVQEK